jgi:hypothetical protein
MERLRRNNFFMGACEEIDKKPSLIMENQRLFNNRAGILLKIANHPSGDELFCIKSFNFL